MSRSSKSVPITWSGSGGNSPRRPGAEPPDSYSSQIEELTQDLIGAMTPLSRDERRRERIAKKLF